MKCVSDDLHEDHDTLEIMTDISIQTNSNESLVCVPLFMYAMQYFRTFYILYPVKCLSVSNDGECTFSPSFHAWQCASFELRRGYFPLLVLFRK